MPDATTPKDYPPLVRAVSDRTRKNPRHSKVSRSTAERIMTVIAAGLPLDQVDDPAVPDDVTAVLPFGRHLVEIVVAEWRAVIAERAAAAGNPQPAVRPQELSGGAYPTRDTKPALKSATALQPTPARAHQSGRPSTADRPGGVDA